MDSSFFFNCFANKNNYRIVGLLIDLEARKSLLERSQFELDVLSANLKMTLLAEAGEKKKQNSNLDVVHLYQSQLLVLLIAESNESDATRRAVRIAVDLGAAARGILLSKYLNSIVQVRKR